MLNRLSDSDARGGRGNLHFRGIGPARPVGDDSCKGEPDVLTRQTSWNQVLGPLLQYSRLKSFFLDEFGQDQIEYVLAAALLALGAISVIPAFAAQVLQCWTWILNSLNSAIGTS